MATSPKASKRPVAGAGTAPSGTNARTGVWVPVNAPSAVKDRPVMKAVTSPGFKPAEVSMPRTLKRSTPPTFGKRTEAKFGSPAPIWKS